MIATIVISVVLVILAGLAIFYIVRKKKQGGCVGCHSSGNCSGNCSCCSGHEEPAKNTHHKPS